MKSPQSTHSLLLVLLSVALIGSTSAEPRLEEVQKALDTEILPPGLPLEQVRVFAETRVPEVPDIKDADEWRTYSEKLRKQVLDKIVFRGNLAKFWRDSKSGTVWDETIEDLPGYRIRKLRFEILPGWWCPALLYEPLKLGKKKVPVIINVNGHDGKGKAATYKQIRCIHLARNGMLALNVEWIGMGQFKDRMSHYHLAQLDLCGISGMAPFYLNVSRALDLALEHPNADPERVAVAGLSGGGWQTIFFSSLDTRVKLCNPVAGYSSFKTRARHPSDLGDSEQTPNDLATLADYTHLTALMSDRAMLLTKNAKDQCCFAAPHALPPLRDAAEPKFKLLGRNRYFRTHINHDPGTHNFLADNRLQFYRMLNNVFHAPKTGIKTDEKHTDAEILDYEQLVVPLPKDNLNFNKIASYLAESLPIPVPGSDPLAGVERHIYIPGLHHILHTTKYQVRAKKTSTINLREATANTWKLQLGKDWTVPMVELVPQNPSGNSIILLGDDGRGKLANQALAHLSKGRRVLALDPFYYGESQLKTRGFLHAILVAAVGERPLGIQVSQVAAIARWVHEKEKKMVDIEAHGPRTSTIALTATTLDIKNIRQATLHRSLDTLKSLIRDNHGANKYPELFCFGLLEYFDIPEMTKLANFNGKERIFVVQPKEN